MSRVLARVWAVRPATPRTPHSRHGKSNRIDGVVYLPLRIVHNALHSGGGRGYRRSYKLCDDSRREVEMILRNVLVAACLIASLALVIRAEQGPPAAGTPGQEAGRQGGGRIGG